MEKLADISAFEEVAGRSFSPVPVAVFSASVTGVPVKLTGVDGNAFNILAVVMRAMREAHVEKETIDAFKKEAMSSDYNHLLQTCVKYCDVS